MKKFTIMLVLLFSMFFYTDQTKADSGSQLLIINKKINQLAYYNGGTLVKTFRVATGRDDSLTPEGNFKIVTKIVNRPYYTGNIPGGDPRNPLGNRWMGLDARGTYGTTYAIHGNNNENSIGSYVSSGCIRMHNDEIRWLFDQVQLYTPVIITNTNDTFDTIAASNGYYVVSGWKQTNGKWYFYDGNGVMKTGWLLDGGRWYYLDGNGAMKTGWTLDGGKWYYLDGSGVMKTGWLSDGGKWYYLDGSGVMKTGWISDGGKWYYLDGSGVMKTGWLLDGGKWYYLDKSGVMKTGWLLDGGKWYYLDKSGVMKTGWLLDGGKWYYLDGSGVMKTGWISDGGKWYYLDGSGVMKTGWVKVDDDWYYFYDNGSRAASTIIDGYKLDKDGVLVKVEYLALGDSLAAGQTPYGKMDAGYPNFIKERFQKSYHVVDFNNFGTAGYTSVQLKNDVLYNEKVQKEIKEASHITIDIGLNDLAPVIQTNSNQAQEAIQNVSANLETILSTIDNLNNHVHVYVMGYYNPFPYQSQEQQATLLPLLHDLNTQMELQANSHGDTFVPTEKAIEANYAEYIPNQSDAHLSLAGYNVVAGEFWKAVSKN
ncbi:L,D-transpeptidase family protein [Bacillus sp. S14(2024)]|uniref:L,D-transpeptidase family protein n=2 Tax=Bacillus sp. S14(2024) TaxID=3162884 RepID=UPI003D1CC575